MFCPRVNSSLTLRRDSVLCINTGSRVYSPYFSPIYWRIARSLLTAIRQYPVSTAHAPLESPVNSQFRHWRARGRSGRSDESVLYVKRTLWSAELSALLLSLLLDGFYCTSFRRILGRIGWLWGFIQSAPYNSTTKTEIDAKNYLDSRLKRPLETDTGYK